jgi:hypothetical protein
MGKYTESDFFSVPAITAFVSREAELRGRGEWPLTRRFNDEDFCELYRIALDIRNREADLRKRVEELEGENRELHDRLFGQEMRIYELENVLTFCHSFAHPKIEPLCSNEELVNKIEKVLASAEQSTSPDNIIADLVSTLEAVIARWDCTNEQTAEDQRVYAEAMAVIKKAKGVANPMYPRITYTCEPDNTQEVEAFIGPVPPCPRCGGSGEYEAEDGPRGCMPCNSRCIAYIDFEGKRRYLDWGETLERRGDGLHLVTERKV